MLRFLLFILLLITSTVAMIYTVETGILTVNDLGNINLALLALVFLTAGTSPKGKK